MEIGSNQDPFIKSGSTFESMIKSVGDLGLDFLEICPEYMELSFETLSPERRAGGLELAKSYDVGFTVHAPWCEPLSTISSVNEGIKRELLRQVKESLKLAYDLEAPLVGERFGCLHIHDNDGSSDQHLPIGQGTINYPKYLKRLVAMGYRRPYILEHTSIDHLKASKEALESIRSTF